MKLTTLGVLTVVNFGYFGKLKKGRVLNRVLDIISTICTQ